MRFEGTIDAAERRPAAPTVASLAAVARRRRPLASSVTVSALAALVWLACAASDARGRAPAGEPAPLRYAVTIPEPNQHYAAVTILVDAPRGQQSEWAMPAWTPGSYVIRDHGRQVDDLQAETLAGAPLPVEHRDKQTWRVGHGGQPHRLRYRVYADELTVRTSHVDDRHASLIGASVFLYPVGEGERPAEVELRPPAGWRVFAALPGGEGGALADGVARLRAPSYDALIDAPIELGTPETRRVAVGGKAIDVVLTAPAGHNADLDRVAGEVRAIVAAAGALMGGLPFERYVFLIHATSEAGGGLEHASSSSLQIRHDLFKDEGGYKRLAHLAAHELFHLWNVKRIRDRALVPYDLRGEDYTRLLWFHEGFTETIEQEILLRSGHLDGDALLRELGASYTAYRRKPGRNHEPIGELSHDAWTRAYKPATHHQLITASYYEKGGLLGVALDLELRLRAAKHGQKGSLGGLFRRLMASHGARGRGITQADVVAAASAEAGEAMDEFFARYVDGTEELPLEALLPRIGVAVEVLAPWEEPGLSPFAAARARAWIGVETKGQRLGAVLPGSPADRAGLSAGDEIVAVAGRRVRSDGELRDRLADHPIGAAIEITAFRGDRLVSVTLTLGERPDRIYRLRRADDGDVSPQIRGLRERWLAPPTVAEAIARADAAAP